MKEHSGDGYAASGGGDIGGYVTVRGGTTRIGGSWQSGQGENFEGA
jgi:hypothetical protein